jgi:UDP-N-acetylmuramoyl-tripeptide--D-alanyl-D-alanine ligase
LTDIDTDHTQASAADLPLWNWVDLCRALDIEACDGPDIHGVCIDSRRIQPGDLFIALTGDPGPRFNPSQRSERDGHDFIAAAMQAGAAGVLAHDGARRDIPQLQVADTLDALWRLGAAARARLHCPVVAVTGSSGKTTTKNLLAAALGAFCTEGSLNNHLGVPLSLMSTPEDASAAVYELGTNHPGEIGPLAELVGPNVAIVLNVHPAHAERFTNLSQLRSEKLSIYKGLKGKGHLIVEDLIALDELPTKRLEERQYATFGRSDAAQVRFLRLANGSADYVLHGETVRAHVPGGGEHRAVSLAAVLATLEVLGSPLGPALSLPDELIPRGRGTETRVGDITVIDDSYNANPESMKAALLALAQRAPPTLAVLGEMLELGADGPDYHRALVEQCAGIGGVICVGAGMQALYNELPETQRLGWFPAAGEELLDALAGAVTPGVSVLVKGSNRVFWAQNFVVRLTESLG